MAIHPDTFAQLHEITILGEFNTPVSGVSIDTRTLKPGDLFIAFTGAQVDGHDFIPVAISRGASAVMTSTEWAGKHSWNHPVPLIHTRNPVESLGNLARIHRQRFNIPIIAVTGTNGKTSTKNLVSHLLKTKYSTLYTKGNYNNNIGLPISLLSMESEHEFAVLEMGASRQGDIDELCKITLPTQGLITNINVAHTEFFNGIEGVQQTKAELFEFLAKNSGKIYVNRDDDRIKSIVPQHTTSISYGFKGSGDYTFELHGPDNRGHYQLNLNEFSMQMPLPGKAIALNAAAAITVALENDISLEDIGTQLKSYTGESGRMQRLQVGDVVFFNDAYNANPASVSTSLETIRNIPSSGRKIMVFGDMLELGSESHSYHRDIGYEIAASGFDKVFLLGQHVKATAEALKLEGIHSFFYSEDKDQLIQALFDFLQPEDLVLLKGSRAFGLETIIQSYEEQS